MRTAICRFTLCDKTVVTRRKYIDMKLELNPKWMSADIQTWIDPLPIPQSSTRRNNNVHSMS